MQNIPLTAIFPNPSQPRKRFDPDLLAELADSIERNGLIQPISVRAEPDGRYMIVAGERRYRAHLLLQERGVVDTIPAIVQLLDDAQLAINAIIENDVRVDVSLMEQARSYRRMIDVHGFTTEALAEKIGKKPHKVAQILTLNNLTEQCQQLLEGGNLYFTQALALATLSERGQGLLLRQINLGQCRTVTALNSIAETIRGAEAQVCMFGEDGVMDDAKPAATVAEISAARGFEAKLESVAAMLRSGIDDNTIVAVRKVNPGRAGTVAEMLAQMQRDLHRLEAAFRVAAVRDELEGAAA